MFSITFLGCFNTSIIFFIIAVILYVFSPKEYSYNYCLIIFIVYVFSSVWFLINTFDGNYFNFHFLFLISFLFVNFIYPVLLYPYNKTYFPVYKLPFNEDIITKATSIALLGIISYFLGATILKWDKNRLINSF